MIDTMAFLLVFFMIASLAMTRQQGMPVNLPRTSTAAPQTWGDRALVVTITREGKLYLNKSRVGLAELKSKLEERLSARPDSIVVINADEDLRHGVVMRVMDLAKQAGARQMAVATRPPEQVARQPE